MNRRSRVRSARPRDALWACEPLEHRLLLSRTIHVDIASPGPVRDGASWATAYTDLQQALTAAATGDRIHVADGIYRPTAGTDRTAAFQLRSGVAILGGYAGFGAADPDERDPAVYATVLSGDIGVPGSNADNSYRVVTGSQTDATAVLDGFTITGGNANGPGVYSDGGGMYIDRGSPTISGSRFTGNVASRYGGGMYNTSATPRLVDCIFSGNQALGLLGSGGGIYNASSSPVLINCTFTGNSASYYGGGIYNSSSSPALTGCTFVGNSARSGGGMYNASSSSAPTLVGCGFIRNRAELGGGMFNDFASPTLIGCTFAGNVAEGAFASGGGIFNDFSSAVFINSVFVGNTARGNNSSGGGMFSDSSSLTFINCTFSGNSAGEGGGMFNWYSTATLTNCILWGNVPEAMSNPDSTASVTYSLVQGGRPGTGNINVDPLFVRSPGPGPDGTWGTGDDDYGDLRLQRGSPAIDAGNSSAVPQHLATDLDGNPRILGSAVDMGAYEAIPPVLILSGTDAHDVFYIRLASTGGHVEVYRSSTPAGQPHSVYALASLIAIRVEGGAGADALYIDFTNGNPIPTGGIVFDSPGGRLIIAGTRSADGLTVHREQVIFGDSVITSPDMEQVLLTPADGGAVTLGSLSLGPDATLGLAAAEGLVLNTGLLSIAPTATLDLAGNSLILRAGGSAALAEINDWIASARSASPAWSGFGLTSSLAAADPHRLTGLSALRNDRGDGQPLYATFAGQPVSVGDVLVRHTWTGDIDLNGIIDGDDYFRIDSGFLFGRKGLEWGDLNGDGRVDASDYLQMDRVFLARLALLTGSGVMDREMTVHEAHLAWNPFSRQAVMPVAPAEPEPSSFQRSSLIGGILDEPLDFLAA